MNKPNNHHKEVEGATIGNPFKRELPKPDLRKVKQRYKNTKDIYIQHLKENHPSKSFFYDTAFGRTLSARNRTGRLLRRIGGGALVVGLGSIGIDVATGSEEFGAGGYSQLIQQIEQLILTIGAILYGIGIGSDKLETVLERRDEDFIMTDKDK